MEPRSDLPEPRPAEASRGDRPGAATDLDPFFVFDFRPVDGPDDEAEGPAAASGRRWSTFWDVERLCRGPEPRPDWVVADRAAVDTELGVLKTGKEADVLLLDRSVPGADPATPGASVVLAAKRYRSEEHRTFHRSSAYTEGRRTRNTRDARAMAKKTAHGRAVAAGQWAWAEWEVLKQLWSAGLPVPYPVQVDGTEILMELVLAGEEPAPRLAQTRPSRGLLVSYFDQLREAMLGLTGLGLAHGDLSPYNILAADERLVLIDLPQVVDLVANPSGLDFLARDCRNVATWFTARGLPVDEHALFADLLAVAF